MKYPLALITAALLTACGGGSVNCTGASACVFNVTGNTVTAPVAASAPSGAASSPSTPTPAPQSVPFAQPKRTFPITAIPGDLRFTAGGITYLLAVVTNGDAVWVALYSAPTVGDSVPMTSVEAMLDNSLDLHMPAADDAAIRAYLASVVVPKLDAWLRANSGRFASGMTVHPTSTSTVPSGTAQSRLAGRLPQVIEITPFGASLVG